jgi:hypothetical protein
MAVTLATPALLALLALPVPPASGAAAASSTPDAATLYREAIATTRSWSVHYSSSSTQSNVNLALTGDAGPASGSQTVTMGTGSINIVVIGGITYLQGNASGLQNLAGFSASQAATAMNQWIQFATTNAAFAPVVAGVRSHDVAQELALKGPYSLGRSRTLDGFPVDAIAGTQTLSRHSVHVVLYVRARGTHVPVEEDSVNAKGQSTAVEHVVYSRWGELVRPQAPRAAITIGPVSSV